MKSENKEIAKNYNDCNSTERQIIREYKSWCKSDAPVEYRIEMANHYRIVARSIGIEHLL